MSGLNSSHPPDHPYPHSQETWTPVQTLKGLAPEPVRLSPVLALRERIDHLRREAHRLETLLFAWQNSPFIMTGEAEEALVWLINNQR